MKAFSKPLTWLLTFFNVGVYNLSDNIDSLVIALKFTGLQDHANRIILLSEAIEYQQGIMILLDSFKCLFMLISLVFFFMTNQAIICKSFRWIQTQFKQFFFYQKTF
ncbi:hypothetical protein [Aureispira anguillae]|uniref:Uncharacterized protein n=1 Tax=Aureispira anguillae TaxID=2864201 RepID=A0A915YH08_9BACT|nr:hypothetical protein [Aureispira anguillae]BDS12783.1 hypothetical protein AsAng_0035080 [Aureispira anguillae]